MTKAAKTASARPSPTAPDAALDEGRLKLQALAGTRASDVRRPNWELRALGVLGFELASARD